MTTPVAMRLILMGVAGIELVNPAAAQIAPSGQTTTTVTTSSGGQQVVGIASTQANSPSYDSYN
jgi:hypothetical protein